MRRLHGLLLGFLTVLLLSACSRELSQPGLNPNGEVVRINLDAPEAIQLTRSLPGTSSELGGLTNVDWTKYDLRYQLAVYSEDGSQLLVPTQSNVYDTYSPTVFEFRLTPNNTYKFVAWADFVEQGTTTDLHYNTSDLSNITINTDGDRDKTINDESRDAFFISKDVAIAQTFDETLTLKRPFAKIRIVTTDWDDNNGAVAKPDNFKVTYHDCSRFNGINAVTGKAIEETAADASTVYTATLATDGNGGKYYAGGHDANANSRTLLVDYLIATSEQQAIHFNIDMLVGTKTVKSHDFTTEIPIQRNYLTTLIGNLLSINGSVTIEIDEAFNGENSVEIKAPKYITYKASQKLDYMKNSYDPRFWGADCVFIEDMCTYDPVTQEGKWAYTGTVTYITDAAFSSETSLIEIHIPESVVEVGRNLYNETGGGGAFQNCSALTTVVFEGNNLTKINHNTFNLCSNLASIQLPENITLIELNAFKDCSSLVEITLPDAVKTIEKQAFSFCTGLKKVTLGTQLESIGNNAFNECEALETVICPDETPATLGTGAFPLSDGWYYTANYKIYVPDAQVDTYRTAWPAYWDSSSAFKITKVIYGMSTMP